MADLRDAGVRYFVRSWPRSEAKGIDDLALTLSRKGGASGMNFPFVDQSESDFLREQEARDRAAHLKLVHSAAFDEAYFHTGFSTQKTEEEVETRESERPVEPANERRVETPDDRGVVENFSTQSGTTDSTTYDFGESEPEPNYDLSEYVWTTPDGGVDWKYPPPGNPELDAAIEREVARLKNLSVWASVEARMGKGGADAEG